MSDNAEWVPAGDTPAKENYTPDELLSRLFKVLQEGVAEVGTVRRVVTSAIHITIEGIDVTLTMETRVPLRKVRLLKRGEIAA